MPAIVKVTTRQAKIDAYDSCSVMAIIKGKTCKSADVLSLDEGNVDDGRVVVDKLKDEYFEDQLILKLRLSSMHLCINNKSGFNGINRSANQQQIRFSRCK